MKEHWNLELDDVGSTGYITLPLLGKKKSESVVAEGPISVGVEHVESKRANAFRP